MSNLESLMESPSKPTTPKRGGRHQLKRSLTEFPSPEKLHPKEVPGQTHEPIGIQALVQSQQNSHKPWLPFRKDKHSDDKGATSAANPLSSLRHSLDMARSETATPLFTPAQSRRPSVSGKHSNSRRQSVSVTRSKNEKAVVAAASEKQLHQEQEAASLRTAGLKQAVSDLSMFSTTTTKRLDDTYYSVLEKMSSLQSTISALKELAESSRDICTTFGKESQGLEHDVVTQLSKFAYLGDQESKIEGLHERIRKGRDRMKTLSGRVDLVRKKIEGWDQADQEWQQRTRKRLMWLWTCGTVITLVLIALLLGVRYTSPEAVQHVADGITRGVQKTGETFSADGPLADALLNITREVLPSKDDDGPMNMTLNWKTPTVDEERLRALDEL